MRQAYIELGDTEMNIFGLRVGRQQLIYGDQRLIGNSRYRDAGSTSSHRPL